MSPQLGTFIQYFHFILATMQAEYQILPKRNGKSDGSFKKLQTIKYYTNYFDISLNTNKSQIYQYSFTLPETIPQDSEVYGKSISFAKKTLKQKLGYVAHSGQMIWGTTEMKVPMTVVCKPEHDGVKHDLEAIVKPTKKLDLKELDQADTRQKYLQILNVNLKNTLKAMKLTELGKPGNYFQSEFSEDKNLESKGLQVLKGYRFIISPLNSGLFLQIDVCSRVLQAKNLLEIFNGKHKDYNIEKFTGTTVISKYGTYRTYKIQKIDYEKSPQSKFQNDKKGVEMTYIEYYKEAYGLLIKNNKQPLLWAIKNIEKVLDKETKQYKEVKHYVYLVPEFVSPTGMTDEQRADSQTMRALDPFTKLSPDERVLQCEDIITQFNEKAGLVQIKGNKRFQGVCLNRPDLLFSKENKIQPDIKGNVRNRGVLKEPFHFTDWVFCYSTSDADADDAVALLKNSASAYGVQFKEPGWIAIDRNANVNDWKKQLKTDIEKNGASQIVVLYLQSFEEKYYSQLKKYITNELNCPSQFIRKQTLTNPKRKMSAASKIVIQMNIKVGAVPWEVQKNHEYFKSKNLMYGALSISKGDRGHTLAFVGTINSECTKVFSACKYGIKDKENIPVKDFEEIFVNWAKSYYQLNKKVPGTIILYREGLSVQQTAAQIKNMQLPALDGMIAEIGAKTKTVNYKPQVMVLVVNKKVNSRYYNVLKESQGGKFPPKVENVNSGSILVEPLSSDNSYDFHLAAQYVTRGTCTPTLFRVAYDTTKMPQEALINFTFEQCFNYYNWEGAVRVPACLQCANKLSKLVSMHVKESIKENAVTKKHFFL